MLDDNRELLELYRVKLLRQYDSEPTAFPHITHFGKWVTTPEAYWSSGFWVGQFWLLWHYTKDSRFRSIAERYQVQLDDCQSEALIESDLGMLYYYSFALGHRLTGSDAFRDKALSVAEQLLALSYSKAGLVIHKSPERIDFQGNHTASSIIDVMMNLQLLWWAHDQTNDERYWLVAKRHAECVVDWFVRQDGSTAQVVDFDMQTGDFIRQDTHQGFSPVSCWSRGQAWAIYGFLQAYQYTHDPAFADCFERLLRFWTKHIPVDYVPYWDFFAPAESQHVRDTSAAAILCAALSLARRKGIMANAETNHLYYQTILSLKQHYLQPQVADGILAHGCLHFPAGRGVNEATVFGDYFLLEALIGTPKNAMS